MGDFSQLLHRISEPLIFSPQFPDPPLDSGWRLLPFFWRDHTFGWGHEIVGHGIYSTPLRRPFSTPLNAYLRVIVQVSDANYHVFKWADFHDFSLSSYRSGSYLTVAPTLVNTVHNHAVQVIYGTSN